MSVTSSTLSLPASGRVPLTLRVFAALAVFQQIRPLIFAGGLNELVVRPGKDHVFAASEIAFIFEYLDQLFFADIVRERKAPKTFMPRKFEPHRPDPQVYASS